MLFSLPHSHQRVYLSSKSQIAKEKKACFNPECACVFVRGEGVGEVKEGGKYFTNE